MKLNSLTAYFNPQFIVLIGLLIRLLVIPFTLNWDLWANSRLISELDWNNFTNFYKNPLAVYPPLTYTTLKFSFDLLKPLAGGLIDDWLTQGDLSSLSSPFIFRYLFLIKLPYLIFEIATAYIFVRLFAQKQRLLAYLLWWWNPIIIFLVSAWTNVDIFVLFFIIAALKAHQQNRLILASILLSIGISYKLLPIFFFPFIFSTFVRKKDFLLAILTCSVVIFLGHLPVAASLQTYLKYAITGGFRDLVLFSILPIGAGRALIIVYLLYFLLLFFFIQHKEQSRNEKIFDYYFIILAILFSFSKFGLQWFLWLVPFLNIIFIKLTKTRYLIILVYFLYCLMIIMSQSSLNIGMLGPIMPTLWRIDYLLKNIIGERQINTVFDTLHTLLAAALIYLGFYLLINKNKQLKNC